MLDRRGPRETIIFCPRSNPGGVVGVTVTGKMTASEPLIRDLTETKANIVTTPDAAPITLDQFLKTTGLVGTGGQAKIAIQEGYVTVNGELETRRRRKLAMGDVIVVDNEHKFVVTEESIRRY